MDDMTQIERDAVNAVLPHLAGYLEKIGWNKRFSDLSKSEVEGLIVVIHGAFQDTILKQLCDDVPF